MNKLISIRCTGLGSTFFTENNYRYTVECSSDTVEWTPITKYVSNRAPLVEQNLTSETLLELIKKSKKNAANVIDLLVDESVRWCKITVYDERGVEQVSATMELKGEF